MTPAFCSFCGKAGEEVDRLIAGAGVYICNECVGRCQEIIDDGSGARAGYRSVNPRMVVTDVDGAVAFLRATFDAVGDVVEGLPCPLRIGDSLVMVGGAGERDAFPAFLYVYVADADDTYRRAVAAGATTIEAPWDTPYGDRRAMVADPWGNRYQIAHVIPPEGPGWS